MSVKVRAEWDGYNWVGVPDVGGVTQAKRLDLIAANAVEVVKLMTGKTIKPSDVELEVVVPGMTSVSDAAVEIAQMRADIDTVQSKLTKRTLETVRRLHAKGFTLRDIGTIVGLSHQRVDQLLR